MYPLKYLPKIIQLEEELQDFNEQRKFNPMPINTLGQNEPRVIAKTAGIGFRPNIDNIDEIVTDNCRLHLEFMDNDLVWMDIELPNGEEYHINIYHKDSKCHKHLKCSGERVK